MLLFSFEDQVEFKLPKKYFGHGKHAVGRVVKFVKIVSEHHVCENHEGCEQDKEVQHKAEQVRSSPHQGTLNNIQPIIICKYL